MKLPSDDMLRPTFHVNRDEVSRTMKPDTAALDLPLVRILGGIDVAVLLPGMRFRRPNYWRDTMISISRASFANTVRGGHDSPPPCR